MKLKPDLQLSIAAAQAIVDHAIPEQAVATISKLHGGEIAAVYEIAFVDPANSPLILKLYDDRQAVLEGYGAIDRKNWSQTLSLYRLYFVLVLWCWMDQIGNSQALDGLASDLERYSAI